MSDDPLVLSVDLPVTQEVPATVEMPATDELPSLFVPENDLGWIGRADDELIGVLGGLGASRRVVNALAWALVMSGLVMTVVVLRLIMSFLLLVAS